MEKPSEKGKWQSMTTSARKMFRPKGTDALKADMEAPTCSQTSSLQSKGPRLSSGSSTASLSLMASHDLLATGPLISQDLAHSSFNSSNGSQFPVEQKLAAETDQVTDCSFTPTSGDGKRTLMRYIAAVEELKAALKLRRSGWETFEFTEFDVIPESDGSLALLQEAIDEKLNSCHELGDTGIWQKGKMLAERLFVALSPFAKNFLTVAKGASQSVRTRGVCADTHIAGCR